MQTWQQLSFTIIMIYFHIQLVLYPADSPRYAASKSLGKLLSTVK
jgi:hypothetical protein